MSYLTVRQNTGTAKNNRWGVILAGGEGTRLRSLTRSITGDERPKQFCPLIGGRTLLDQTRRRVALSVQQDQTLIVVTKSHEQYYHSLPKEHLCIQPTNRGTAPAILYSLLSISAQAPDAIVAVFPSDHYFDDDEKFMSYVDQGFAAAQRDTDMVTLLGITPETPEVEFGWIEPHQSILASLSGSVTRVNRFWEKPSLNTARRLMSIGCLWNSFVMIGHVGAFLKMIRRALPDTYDYFEATIPWSGTPTGADLINEVYAWTPEINFSHEVLANRTADLTVMKVDNVGWNDLGEPARVLATLSHIGVRAECAATAS